MIGARCARFALIGLLAAMLPACGSDESDDIAAYESGEGLQDLPSTYGLYAIQDGQLGRLDGARTFQVETWESRSDLQPGVQFIVFDRALDDRSVRLQNVIKLRQVAHVRNEVAATGMATPTSKDIWVAADLPEFAVPLDFAPIPGRAEMVRAMPNGTLAPGLYELELRHGDSVVSGRFGVGWGGVDQDSYIAANCVDRYAGQAAKYRPCSDGPPQTGALPQPKSMTQFEPLPPAGSSLSPGGLAPSAGASASPSAAPPSAAPPRAAPSQTPSAGSSQLSMTPKTGTLELRQVQATKADDQGVPILTVQGVIVNVSKAVQPVPRLVATIKDLQGAELDSWSFTAEVTHLPPGGSTGFRTETVYPTTQSTNVSVTFSAPGAGS